MKDSSTQTLSNEATQQRIFELEDEVVEIKIENEKLEVELV